jgi:hypothetical protein
MPPGPPKILEWFFGIWIPPACREEVLGDLCEKYSSPLQYVCLAILAVPCVILSRARRVTEAPVLFMQALLVYGCYLVAAFYRDSAFLYGPYGLLRTALPLLPFLLVAVLFDVYSPPAKSALQLAGRVAFATLTAFLMMARTLPDWMNLLGASAALLLVTAVRILFRSDPNLQQAAGPVHWLKQTTAPIAVSRGTLSVVATILALTAAAIIGLSIGLKPGAVGIVIVLLLLFGFGLHRPRKD